MSLPEGWTEAYPGGIATNLDEKVGGIVDVAILSGEWFVLFNDDGIDALEGFGSRDEAFQALANTLKIAKVPETRIKMGM